MMLELLTALSILMMVASLLVPQTISILQERKNIRLAHTARVVLREQMIAYRLGNHSQSNTICEVETVVYTVSWKQAEERGNQACVEWQDVRENQKKLCRYVA